MGSDNLVRTLGGGGGHPIVEPVCVPLFHIGKKEQPPVSPTGDEYMRGIVIEHFKSSSDHTVPINLL